jgi:hypothetical protein
VPAACFLSLEVKTKTITCSGPQARTPVPKHAHVASFVLPASDAVAPVCRAVQPGGSDVEVHADGRDSAHPD